MAFERNREQAYGSTVLLKGNVLGFMGSERIVS